MEAIPTGSISLDLALGIGGVPKGRIIEIYGPESSGKTTLALHIAASAQKAGGEVAFVDAEHALEPAYARALGVDIENLLISQPDTGEDALAITETLVRSGAVDVVVVDSVAALVPRSEIEGEMGDSSVGVVARLMSQALRKLAGSISKTNCVVIFINQLREKIGVMYGNPETTPGGRALKYFSSVRIDAVSYTHLAASSSDSLYKLPEATDKYIKIQQKIDEIQGRGEEFAAPSSGYNRQAIQLHDVDGDCEEEVVAFFRTNGDKPLKIYILKSDGEDYEVAAEIEGDGAAIDSIAYVDMDGDGVSELLLGWQMSSSVKLLTIYSIREYQPVQLATDSYSTYTYCDMDGDGDNEVTVFHTDTTDSVSDMTMYMLMHDGEMVSYSANLSASADSIAKVQNGMFGARGRALYVDSARGNGVITDIIVFNDDALTNITVNPETGDSGTYRPYSCLLYTSRCV